MRYAINNEKILNGNSSENTEIKKIIGISCPHQNFRYNIHWWIYQNSFLFTDISQSLVFGADELSEILRGSRRSFKHSGN